jgi:hypothetical protein
MLSTRFAEISIATRLYGVGLLSYDDLWYWLEKGGATSGPKLETPATPTPRTTGVDLEKANTGCQN